ncbi:T9SS type A sorting domain-containing protein [Larkinella insperata]|uniref:T9SS type A sorting domain-containing protein n=1 Tax=Larkinella insperata TaxID=332158 RepID=A0ABW3Q6Z0_9BACT
MKHFFTAWLLTLAASFSARAQPPSLSYTTSGLYTYTVPDRGPVPIRISVMGGHGGSGSLRGGQGATAVSIFTLQPGDQLTLMVGQAGGSDFYGSGGGGGSAVVLTRQGQRRLLLVAGGGGGGGSASVGQGGQGVTNFINGGSGGTAASVGRGGGGGGGYNSPGSPGGGPAFNAGGGQASLTDLSEGGGVSQGAVLRGGNGFGGGGKGDFDGVYTPPNNFEKYGTGGGGGGYSGGVGGSGTNGGGGGGSYADPEGQNTSITAGADGGGVFLRDGSITLDFISNATAFLTRGSTLCASDSVTLTGILQVTGNWTVGLSDGTTVKGSGPNLAVKVKPVTTTTYTIQSLIDERGVALAANLTGSRTVSPPPSVELTSNGPVTCARPTVELKAVTSSAGGSYQFLGPGINQLEARNSAFITNAGSYTVTYTDLAGCKGQATTEVGINTVLPDVRVNPPAATLSCANPAVTLTASGGDRYAWSTGGNSPSIEVSRAGSYSVTATSSTNGCSATASVEVKGSSQAPQITLTNNGPLTANQPQVVLTVVPAGESAGETLSYVFSGGATAGSSPSTARVTAPGIYSVTATAPNGCTASAQTTVEAQAGTLAGFELINAVSDQLIKPLSDGEAINLARLPTTKLTIRALTSPATVGSVVFSLTGTVTYSKTETGAPYALFGDTQGNYDPWTLPLGRYTLTATPYLGAGGSGPAGTPLTLNFSIVNQATNQAPIARAGADQALILPASSVTLNGSASSDPEGGALSYQWSQQSGPSPAHLPSPTAPTLTASGLVEGRYVFGLTVRDEQGATGYDELTVLVNAPASQPQVVSVSLMNADDESEIKVLNQDEEINLATLVTKNLNLRVNTSPQAVGSVKMVLSGPQSRTQTDNGIPYAVFGDSNGNFNGWTPKTGRYSLAVTPYSGANATGQAGAVYTVAFTVVSQTTSGPGVVSFSLIDADRDVELMPLLEGQVINLASLPTRNLNIKANTRPPTVGSVRLVLSGAQSRTQVDNGAPYAVFGDKSGNYNAWTPALGSYSLTGTTFNGTGATGQAGGSLTINFRVVSQASPARLTTHQTAEDPEMKLNVYPNPFRESFTLELDKSDPAPVPVVLYDGAGRRVYEQKEAGAKQVIQPGSGLAPGMYLIDVGEGTGIQRRKLLKIP